MFEIKLSNRNRDSDKDYIKIYEDAGAQRIGESPFYLIVSTDNGQQQINLTPDITDNLISSLKIVLDMIE